MMCEIGAVRICRNGAGGKEKGRVEGNPNPGKSVSKACKACLETLYVEGVSWGSVRQARKARVKTDVPVLNVQE